MKKALHRKKRRSVPVPIASMGDIAFLLIIFFMVCSEVSKDNSKAQLTLPFSQYVEKIEIPVVARIAVDENAEIFFDGYRVDSPKDVEMGIRALLTNTVSDDQRHVQFKCDAALPKESFEPVIKAIAEGGGIIEAVGENTDR
jgi:biopolymer transport protein ExbD